RTGHDYFWKAVIRVRRVLSDFSDSGSPHWYCATRSVAERNAGLDRTMDHHDGDDVDRGHLLRGPRSHDSFRHLPASTGSLRSTEPDNSTGQHSGNRYLDGEWKAQYLYRAGAFLRDRQWPAYRGAPV